MLGAPWLALCHLSLCLCHLSLCVSIFTWHLLFLQGHQSYWIRAYPHGLTCKDPLPNKVTFAGTRGFGQEHIFGGKGGQLNPQSKRNWDQGQSLKPWVPGLKFLCSIKFHLKNSCISYIILYYKFMFVFIGNIISPKLWHFGEEEHVYPMASWAFRTFLNFLKGNYIPVGKVSTSRNSFNSLKNPERQVYLTKEETEAPRGSWSAKITP